MPSILINLILRYLLELRKRNNRLFCVSREACPSLNHLPQVTVKRCQELTPIDLKMQRPCSAGVLARTASAIKLITYDRFRYGFDPRIHLTPFNSLCW